MRAHIHILLFSVLLAPLLAAQQPDAQPSEPRFPTPQERLESSPRHHEWVPVASSGERKVQTWVVYPEASGKRPVVLLIHENRGLTDWVRALADELAEAGFLAVAPDLLSGAGPEGGGTAAFASSDAARTALYQLAPEQVLADLAAVVAHARRLEAGNGKVAVTGFCWGGSQAFRFACLSQDMGHEVAAAMVFYGSAPDDEALLERLAVPVHGFYGGNDNRITGQVPALAAKLGELRKAFEPVVYEGAGHAFMRRGEEADAEPANRRARLEAWQRLVRLVESLAGGAGPPREGGPRR